MAWGRKNGDIEDILKPYNAQIEFLESRVEKLEKENERLLEAVLSVQAPDAYREMMFDKATIQQAESISKEDKKRKEVEARTQEAWFQNLEKPIFGEWEEFEDYLRSKMGSPSPEDVQPESVHGNTES